MKLLLDTHAFIWSGWQERHLSPRAQRAMHNPLSEVYISAASIWEVRIKLSTGKLKLPAALEEFIRRSTEEGFRILPIELAHIFALDRLPPQRHDPFDRLLAAQALCESLVLVSKDEIFESYPIKVLW